MDLHEEALPGKKALIAIGGQSVKKYGYLERLEKQLDMAGVEHVLFEGIRPHQLPGRPVLGRILG